MREQRGFTLIELLIVIAIIAVLAAAVFVALNPAQRFAESRNAKRWSDVENIITAAKVHQVDNLGTYSPAIVAIGNGTTRIIGTTGGSCAVACAGAVIAPGASCANLEGASDLVTLGYLASTPISPTSSGGTAWDIARSGYYITKNADGTLTVGACQPDTINGVTPTIVVER